MVCLALVGSILLILTAPAPSVKAQEVPTIYLYVNDLATPHALFSDERNSLTQLCYDIDDITTAEVAILIVNTTLPLGIDMFALQTFESNGIGKQGNDNGVLIVLSMDEMQWRIEVGYGLEGILNDAKVGQIGRDSLTPAFTTEDYYGGLYDAAYAIGVEIVDNYDSDGGAGKEPQVWVLDWKAIGIAVLVFIVISGVTRGKAILFLPNLFKRGRFGGGRSGGGGAKGNA